VRAAERDQPARLAEQHRHDQVAAAGRARDPDAAAQVREPGLEALELDLGPAEVPERG
jgi:hypothetical protein